MAGVCAVPALSKIAHRTCYIHVTSKFCCTYEQLSMHCLLDTDSVSDAKLCFRQRNDALDWSGTEPIGCQQTTKWNDPRCCPDAGNDPLIKEPNGQYGFRCLQAPYSMELAEVADGSEGFSPGNFSHLAAAPIVHKMDIELDDTLLAMPEMVTSKSAQQVAIPVGTGFVLAFVVIGMVVRGALRRRAPKPAQYEPLMES